MMRLSYPHHLITDKHESHDADNQPCSCTPFRRPRFTAGSNTGFGRTYAEARESRHLHAVQQKNGVCSQLGGLVLHGFPSRVRRRPQRPWHVGDGQIARVGPAVREER